MTTHVPGVPQWAFDESTFIWNIWYLQQALVQELTSPLHTELIWYPLGIDLLLYTYNFFHALFAQPLAWAVNLPFGSNVALLFSTVMSGYGVFLLMRYLLRDGDGAYPDERRLPVAAAIVAGILYAFASNRAIYSALGHYDMVTTQWIPFYALMLLRALDGRLRPKVRYKAAAMAGLFFAFNGLAEMITALFLAIFTLIVLAVLLVQRLRGSADSRQSVATVGWKSTLAALSILGGVAFLLWSPILVPVVGQFLADDFSLKGWGEAIPLSTDLLGWFTPTMLHPLFGGDLVAELRRVQLRALELGVTGFRDLNTVFLGWFSLLLALTGALAYRSRVSIWIWTSFVFALFTLGPFLQIDGQYRFDLDGVEATFPLPYALLHYIPIIKANRAPNRNSVLLMLGLAVLAGYGLLWLMARVRVWSRTRRREKQPSQVWASIALGLGVVAAMLIIFEHLTTPLPLSDARIPEVYEQIAQDPRTVSVMNLPLGWRNSFGVLGAERTLLQYYQTAHGKPMLGGNISRAPDFKMGYFERIPFFQALTAIESGQTPSEELLATARNEAGALMALYNTEYVVLHPPIPQRFPYADSWEATWRFVKETLPLEAQPFWTGEGIEAYRVAQPSGEDRFDLDMGAAGTFAYRGEGWDDAESDQVYDVSANWATAAESRLFLPLRNVKADGEYRVALRVRPFAYPGHPTQSVTLQVNDVAFDAQKLMDDWQTLSWSVPSGLLVDGLNRLTLHWGESAIPREVIGGSRSIGETGVELPIDADMKAFADGGFIALFDDAGDQIDAAAGRRGVNVTVLDRESGEVLESRGFDTTANPYESQALADFLWTIEEGQPVLIVSNGDATSFLGEEAVESLRHVGSNLSLEALQGGYFAIAGVAGAQPGSAAVVVDPDEAFLRISLNRDRRSLAAAVDWIEVAPAVE
ncbi:MAG: hypothetical protein HC802_11405 [Caldilineaceae bacterium]|nr:hypothetical protein [Caldilineaceae bacterium]